MYFSLNPGLFVIPDLQLENQFLPIKTELYELLHWQS